MWGGFGLRPLLPSGSGSKAGYFSLASWPYLAEQEQQPVTLLGQHQARGNTSHRDFFR